MTRLLPSILWLELAVVAVSQAPAVPSAPVPNSDGPLTTAWPSYRGPGASGVAEGFATPIQFELASGKNVVWRVPVAGLSHSAPVIFGDQIFLTTSVGTKESNLRVGLYGDIGSVEDEGPQEFRVLCLHREDGRLLWSRTVFQGVPKIKRHPKGSHAASTPTTDGTRVIAFFGSEGLHAFSMDGTPLWSRDFGTLDSGYFAVKSAQWGFASSPVLHRGRVLVQCDVQSGSFVACIDAADGKDVWRTPRDEVPTWGAPTVFEEEGRSQVIVNGYKHMGGYDLATGKELWKTSGGGDIPVPTPVVAHGLIFLTSAHGRQAPILAIRSKVEGTFAITDEPGSSMAWRELRRGNYMQTPLVLGDELYCGHDTGALACFDARTGKLHYRERLGQGVGFTASPVAADGKLYFTSEEGQVIVVKAGQKFEVLGRSELDETFMSTPAISRGTLYFRTRSHLVAVAARD